jgi:Skp family chaperone for outer membrane proteins
MYERLDRLRDEVKRAEKRLADAQKKLKAAQERLKEGEASQILSDVGALKLTPEELAKVLSLVRNGQLDPDDTGAGQADTETRNTGSTGSTYSTGQVSEDDEDYLNDKEETDDENY